jgi:hypothetical protein
MRPKPPLLGRASSAGQERGGKTTRAYPLSPWERRERGGLYYTRSRREDGRVVREYIGGSVNGENLALEVECERRQREEEVAFWKEKRERLDG